MNRHRPARDYIVHGMDRARERVVDEMLVIRCQAGERTFFDLLIRRWQRRLWRYARRLTGKDDAAWDVVQETWMAVLKEVRRLKDPAWFPAWVYRIVRNKCADHCRRGSRQRRLHDAVAERRMVNDEACRTDARDVVAGALRQLSPESRELLMLKYGEDLSVHELAFVLGIPAGTVKSRLYHAREQVRRVLEGDDS